MAILKYEGFDHEASASDLFAGILTTLIVNGSNQSASVALTSSTQYNTGQCLGVAAASSTNGSANAYVVLPMTSGSSTVTMGASVSLSSSITNGTVIGFCNGNAGQVYCYIGAGAITVLRGDPTLTSTQLGTTAYGAVSSVGWAFVELSATIGAGTSGSAQVQVNGQTVISLTGINTSSDSTSGVNGLLLGTSNTALTISGCTSYFDDVYACDSTGSAPYNGFLGPVRVITHYPTASVISNFTGLAHHPNWQNVSDAAMDGDNTYNFSSQTGNFDTFTAGALPANTSAVYAVKITAAGRIDDSGLRTVQTYLRSGSAVASGTGVNLVGSYQYFSDIYTNDPSTSAQWTQVGVNLAQFGYRIVPSATSPIAIALLTLPVMVASTLTQTNRLVAVSVIGALQCIASMIIPNGMTTTTTIGVIKSVSFARQFENTSATISLPSISLGTTSITPGLFMRAVSLMSGLISTATITSSRNVTAAASIPTVQAAGNAVLGTGGPGLITIGPLMTVVTTAISTAVTARPTLLIKGLGVAAQGILTIGSAQIAFSTVAAVSTPVVSNIHVGLPAWQGSHAYTVGQRISASFLGVNNAYQCTQSGTSSVATPPNGTVSAYPDNSVVWKYLSHVDYASVAAWAAAIPQTLTQPVVGLLWNDGPITTVAGTPFLTLGSATSPRATSSINTITLKPAPGEGIRDYLSGGATPLYFNSAKGVSFTLPSGTGGINYFNIYESNVIFDGLQFQDPNPTSGSTIIQQQSSCSALRVSNCIIDGYGQPSGASMIQGGTGAFELVNNLIIDRQSNPTDYAVTVGTQSSKNRIVNCTIVAVNTPNSFGAALLANSAAATVENTIIMGYQNSIAGGGGAIVPTDHCLFSTATAGNAAIDNGTNQFSKVAANQFVSATTDFRLLANADAVNAGVPASGDVLNSDDITGRHRPDGVAWDIGAFEY